MTSPTGDLRIDRLLAADYLSGLAERPLEELRAMRAEAEQEETDLSFLRRLLQGHVDILRAERDRRQGGGPAGSLVDALPSILADERVPSHGLGRYAAVEPSDIDAQRRYIEGLVGDHDLADLDVMADATLQATLDVLEQEEAEVSRRRRSVQGVMDALTAELGRRYHDGGANVADLLHLESE
jgi:hypothetical protein